jgi:hypothetical protein
MDGGSFHVLSSRVECSCYMLERYLRQQFPEESQKQTAELSAELPEEDWLR